MVNLPSPSMGEGSGMGVMRRGRLNRPITPTQPSPIKGEGYTLAGASNRSRCTATRTLPPVKVPPAAVSSTGVSA